VTPLRSSPDTRPLSPEAAELVGLQALGWIVGQPELAGSFLAAAGAAPDDLRERAADPEFLGFVLDFLLADEAALLAFAAESGVAPDRPLRARNALPGGALPHWT
jgi:Protein of unknown function (DUF3572)